MTFDRTICDCAECQDCCRRQPGPLAPGDLQEITAFLGLPEEDVRALFVASRGTLVMDRRTGKTRWIGSITPARKADGSCIFLQEGRCSIHPVAPFGCAYFDTHMDVREADPRSSWLARATDSPIYQRLRALLVPA